MGETAAAGIETPLIFALTRLKRTSWPDLKVTRPTSGTKVSSRNAGAAHRTVGPMFCSNPMVRVSVNVPAAVV